MMCASEQNLVINTMKMKPLAQNINLLYAIRADWDSSILIPTWKNVINDHKNLNFQTFNASYKKGLTYQKTKSWKK